MSAGKSPKHGADALHSDYVPKNVCNADGSSHNKSQLHHCQIPVIVRIHCHLVHYLQSKGGVFVSDLDVETAFRFLDHRGNGRIDIKTLRDRLSAFYPDLPLSELRFLMGDKRELGISDIKEILRDNTINHFDPVR
jgi:hypothetical protein